MAKKNNNNKTKQKSGGLEFRLKKFVKQEVTS